MHLCIYLCFPSPVLAARLGESSWDLEGSYVSARLTMEEKRHCIVSPTELGGSRGESIDLGFASMHCIETERRN